MNGKEFTEMRKRQEAAEEVNKIRREKFHQKQQEAEDAERRERRAKLEANKQSMTMVTKNQLTWRELQEIEEAKRREIESATHRAAVDGRQGYRNTDIIA